MSDYLTRLAERLTTRDLAIAPRLRGRFEPDGVEPDGNPELASAETQEERLAGKPKASQRTAARVRHAGPSDELMERSRVDTPPTRREPGHVAPEAAREPAGSAMEGAGTSHRSVETLSKVFHESTTLVVERGRNRTEQKLPSADGGTPPTASRLTRDTAAPVASRRTSGALQSRDSFTPVAAGPGERAVPRGIANEPAPQESDDEGTVVEVSIGRIEVRAPAESPRALRPRRPVPRLTLESYIEQRRGGTR